MTLATAIPATSLSTCSLCGLTTRHPLTNEQGDVFCCPSCREVAALLAEAPAQSAAQVANGEHAENVTRSQRHVVFLVRVAGERRTQTHKRRRQCRDEFYSGANQHHV
ncbi:MAG: hypothetical protein U0V48_00010 [Anaerolineales bacterium]